MFDFWRKLLDDGDFMPRWHCGNWTDGHGWLHIVSDIAVWGAYLAIPCVLVYFASRRPDLPFRKIFWLFGAFILACGTTHLMEAVLFWWPAYRLAGVLKLITAVISWATVYALIPITPRVLSLRTPEALESEVAERHKVEAKLLAMQGDLERRVAERTEELVRLNAAMQSEMVVRHNVEQVLEEEREWFEVTLASIGDAVIVTDNFGRITFLNRMARMLTGWNEKLRDQPLQDVFRIVGEGTGQPALDPVAEVLATRDSSGLPRATVLVTQSGERRHIDSSAAPILNESSEMLGAVLVFRDVTERRRHEEAMREADRHKDEFLAMLGHELRNPLAGIIGAVQVLRQVGSRESEAVAMQDIIQRQSSHMSRMIDDLLEVSRISRGKIKLRLEPVDLAVLARDAVEDCRRGFEAQRIVLTVELPREPVWVRGDATRLTQVLVNLLQNSAKFTDVGGTVHVTLRAAVQESAAHLLVRDTGIGMDQRTLSRAFEPFRQGDQNIDRGQGGLGLGLALVKGLVEMHGGKVSAASQGVGHGSEFEVRLPLLATAPTRRPPAAQSGVQSQLRILIIDDRRDAIYPLQVLLTKMGHHVLAASDGPSGVEAAQREKPDLVLCDIGLPGGFDGYDVARALRGNAGTRHATLVAVTGYGLDDDRRRALEAGFDQHLTKPVGLPELQSLLARQEQMQGRSIDSP
ncbi:MAG: ATP-binding protein [Pirellulales bacterium]